MMAEKFKTYSGQEMHEMYAEGIEKKTFDRWVKLDKTTQQKITDLIKCDNVHDEVYKLKTNISQLMETQKNRAGADKDKGQQGI